MSVNSYDIGDVAVLHATFTATSGGPALPASVYCRVQNGQGSHVATYGYGDGQLVAVGSGVFEVAQSITVAQGSGDWRYRFESSSPSAAEEFTFHVRTSAFS